MIIRLYLLAVMGMLALAGSAQPAAAIEYPWCAQYSGHGGGGRNCGFVSWEQCMETVRGMGGDCERNLFYKDPAEHRAKRTRKHRED